MNERTERTCPHCGWTAKQADTCGSCARPLDARRTEATHSTAR